MVQTKTDMMDQTKIQTEHQTPPRIEYIDGIRGLASLFVVFCHLTAVFLPHFYSYKQDASTLSHIFINSPFNILTNGSVAVHCFFVLSGFLIARKIYGAKSSNVRSLSPVRQYVKLVKIVFPAILFAAILMWCGLMFHLKAAELNPTLNFVIDYNNYQPTFLSAFIIEPFFRVFIEGSRYIGPFWTIRYEFYGAILITSISYFAKDHVKIAKLTYLFCGLIFAFIGSHLLSFAIGALVFDCIERKENDDSWLGKCVRWILSKRILIVVLGILGVYLACINQTMTGIWSPIRHLPGFISNHGGMIQAAGIGLCLICICEFAFLQKILSMKPLKWLGKISAYTYGFHWPITLSLGCGLYLLLAKTTLPYSLIVIIISIAVVAATILLAFAYTKLLPLFSKAEQWIGGKIKFLFMKFKKEKKTGSET